MKFPDFKNQKLDQAEYVALVPQMRLESSRLRALLAQTEAETIQEPKLGPCCVENAHILAAHINELEHRLGTTAPSVEFARSHKPGDNAEGHSHELSRNLSAGFTGNGASALIAQSVPFQPAKKLSPDEQILQARGCKTYSEVAEKMANGTLPRTHY